MGRNGGGGEGREKGEKEKSGGRRGKGEERKKGRQERGK